ncbi:hypothetical protein H4R23_003430 [Coemansia sp. Cherry 401B]|nr:hypothetical protein IWW52_005383 [Coemansia sp. RSA 2704]KAJ2729774.1 hypothetical protein H4R23_003430 [Coemansia sp. Cherry 401B]
MKLAVLGMLSALGQAGFAKCIPRPESSSYAVETPSSDYAVETPSSDYSAVVPSSDVAPSSDYPVANPSSDYSEAAPSSDYSEVDASSDVVSSSDNSEVASSSDYSEAASSSAPEPSSPAETGAAGAYQITESQLDAAVPGGAGQGKCTDSADTSCANNKRAVAALNAAAQKYGITERSEMVAVVALMAFESGSWQYNVNLYPGRPGQGTKAMLMYDFVYAYAKQLYPSQVQDAWQSSTDTDTMNNVRALVLGDDDSFGAGFWYLTTKAAEYHNSGKLKDGDLASFQDYCTSAVGASWDSERQAVWETVNGRLV